jgi:phosphoglycolate phosphatase
MRYKAVLFDMDGTVLDTLADLTNAINHTLSDYGMPLLDKRQVAQYLGNGAAWLMSRAVPEGTPDALREEMLRAYQPWYDSHCAILTAPYPGIVPLMQALREAGVKQAVISNKQDTAVKQLAAQHFPGLLETAVGESETVRRKPNPDAVLAALREMGVEKRDAVYVGDTEVDLRTAENAGLACAVVGWGFRTEEQLYEAGAEHIFQSAEELRGWLLE